MRKCEEMRIGKQFAAVIGGLLPLGGPATAAAAAPRAGAGQPTCSVALMYRMSHEKICTSQCTVISIGCWRAPPARSPSASASASCSPPPPWPWTVMCGLKYFMRRTSSSESQWKSWRTFRCWSYT